MQLISIFSEKYLYFHHLDHLEKPKFATKKIIQIINTIYILTSLTANFRFDGNFVPVIGAPPSADVCRGLTFVSKIKNKK